MDFWRITSKQWFLEKLATQAVISEKSPTLGEGTFSNLKGLDGLRDGNIFSPGNPNTFSTPLLFQNSQ